MCHCDVCHMLERPLVVAGSLLGEVEWQGLAVAAVLALWQCLRMFYLQWPRGPRRTAALVELLPSFLSRGGGNMSLLAEAVL